MGRRRKRSARLVPLLLVIALSALAAYVLTLRVEPAAPAPAAPHEAGTLRVHYVDVGQGDGVFWELPDGSLVVYDCGPPARDADANAMVRYARDVLGRAPGSRIAALIASHGHLDHVGGCDELFETYEVETVFEAWYEGADAPASYRRFLAAIEAEGARVRRLPELRVGDEIVPGATLLWPPSFAPGGWGAIAEASLVVRLRHGETSFCFQGDIEWRQEARLDGRCDVYLVGHHGSRHASSAPWLARMSPRIAVASYGENPYGHPHPETVCRLQQAGATLYATPMSPGAVVVVSDGQAARVLQGEPARAEPCS